MKEKEKNKGGRPKKIQTPEKLYQYFEMYKMDCKNSPIKKMDFRGKDASQVMYLLEKPLTWIGFNVWLNKNKIACDVNDYKRNKNKSYSEFTDIIRAIGDEIYDDQFNGATVGVYSHNIIARSLGLVDKSESKQEVTVKETKIGFE